MTPKCPKCGFRNNPSKTVCKSCGHNLAPGAGGGVGGEKAMRLVVKLYDARNYVRRMTTPEEYRRRIGEYQGYIRQACAKWKLSEIAAMMQLAKKVEHEPIVQAGLFAAYVEMIEPSEGLEAAGDSASDRERKSPNAQDQVRRDSAPQPERL